MSTKNMAATQPSQQEAITPLAALEAEHTMDRAESPMQIKAGLVLILGALTALGPLSTDLYLPALPAVSQDLAATMSLTQLTLTAGILGISLGQVISGPISDARGRRVPLLVGLAIFVLTSVLCSLAPSVTVLTILRFVQGLAGAAGVVIALAIARDRYAGIMLARCISLLMTVNFLAPIIAPVLGGQLLRFASWRGVFAALALISGVFLAVVAWSLDETLPVERRQRGGIASTWAAFRDLLADRRFIGYALTSGFAFTAAIVYIAVSPFVLQTIYGLSPQRFSLVFAINALGLATMSQISARLVERRSPQTLLAVGVGMFASATTALLVVVMLGVGLAGILPLFFVLTTSLGLIAPNATALALATTNNQRAGSAAALLGVFQFSVGAVVAPLVGLGGTTSAVPMAVTIAAFGIAALGTFVVVCRPR